MIWLLKCVALSLGFFVGAAQPLYAALSALEEATVVDGVKLVSVEDLQKRFFYYATQIPEFQALADYAKHRGLQVSLFGGGVAALAHHTKWIMQYELGADFNPDRLHLSLDRVIDPYQDIDIVVSRLNGTPESEEEIFHVSNEALNIFGHSRRLDVLGLKTGWTPPGRLPREAVTTRIEQHSDSYSNILLNLVPQSDQNFLTVIDIIRGDGGKEFFKEVAAGTIKYFYSSSHRTSKRFLEGLNPEIFSVIRLLIKINRFNLILSKQDISKIKEISNQFSPSDISTGYASSWIKKHVSKMLSFVFDVERSYILLHELNLVSRLNDLISLDSDKLILQKQPSPSRNEAAKDGVSRKLALGRLAHTSSADSLSKITWTVNRRPQFLISRQGSPGEQALYGNGVYFLQSHLLISTENTVFVDTLEEAELGIDYEIVKSGILFKSMQNVRIVPTHNRAIVPPYWEDLKTSHRLLAYFEKFSSLNLSDVEGRLYPLLKKVFEEYPSELGRLITYISNLELQRLRLDKSSIIADYLLHRLDSISLLQPDLIGIFRLAHGYIGRNSKVTQKVDWMLRSSDYVKSRGVEGLLIRARFLSELINMPLGNDYQSYKVGVYLIETLAEHLNTNNPVYDSFLKPYWAISSNDFSHWEFLNEEKYFPSLFDLKQRFNPLALSVPVASSLIAKMPRSADEFGNDYRSALVSWLPDGDLDKVIDRLFRPYNSASSFPGLQALVPVTIFKDLPPHQTIKIVEAMMKHPHYLIFLKREPLNVLLRYLIEFREVTSRYKELSRVYDQLRRSILQGDFEIFGNIRSVISAYYTLSGEDQKLIGPRLKKFVINYLVSNQFVFENDDPLIYDSEIISFCKRINFSDELADYLVNQFREPVAAFRCFKSFFCFGSREVKRKKLHLFLSHLLERKMSKRRAYEVYELLRSYKEQSAKRRLARKFGISRRYIRRCEEQLKQIL